MLERLAREFIWLSRERDPIRLATLHRLSRVTPDAAGAFDRLTRIASTVLDAPVALVTLVGMDRQLFAGCSGLPGALIL